MQLSSFRLHNMLLIMQNLIYLLGYGFFFFFKQRECRRPPIPRKRPPIKPEEQSLLSNHPYVERVCTDLFWLFIFYKYFGFQLSHSAIISVLCQLMNLVELIVLYRCHIPCFITLSMIGNYFWICSCGNFMLLNRWYLMTRRQILRNTKIKKLQKWLALLMKRIVLNILKLILRKLCSQRRFW